MRGGSLAFKAEDAIAVDATALLGIWSHNIGNDYDYSYHLKYS